jgi:hypothetical protein
MTKVDVRVRHEHIDAPEALVDRLHELGDVGRVRDVCLENLRNATFRLDELLDAERLLLAVPVVDGHACAMLREQLGGGEPDTSAGAGDERHLVA